MHLVEAGEAADELRLAVAVYAGDADNLAAAHVEADAAHRLHLAGVGIVGYPQVLDLQQFLSHMPPHFLSLGSSASRSPSPSRLKDSIVTQINKATTISCVGYIWNTWIALFAIIPQED